MDVESLREYCLQKPATTEGFPFGGETLVFKVMGKMYALVPLEHGQSMNLKCDPEYAIKLREQYPERIRPGWHMSKTHWNTVSLVDGLPEDLLRGLIDHSYEQVVKGLKKSQREALAKGEY